MAEMSRVPPVSSALAALTEMKNRSADSGDDTGMNFVDVMMARVTAVHQNTKEDLRDTAKDYETSPAAGDDVPHWVDQLKNAEPAKDYKKDPAPKKKSDDTSFVAGKDGCVVKPETKKKPEESDTLPAPDASKKEDTTVAAAAATTTDTTSAPASTDETPVSAATATDMVATAAALEAGESVDAKALKGLQKLAALLLNAEKDGKLSLPANVKMVLEKIAGTEAAEAGQVLPVLQNLITALRKLEDSKGASELQKVLGTTTWPQEMVKLFSDLQVNPGIKADQPITLGKMIKALRMLSHLAQSANKGDTDGMGPNTASMALLLNGAKADDKVSKDDDSVIDPLLGTVKPKKKAEEEELSAMEILTRPLNIPNSQQKPDLNNHPMNPMVKGTPKGELPNVADAFAKGAQQGGRDGAGKAMDAAGGAGSVLGGKGATFDAPGAEPPSSSATGVSPLGAAASLANSRAAAFAATGSASAPSHTPPSPATQQVMVQISKTGITKDTQLSIQLNPAELGKVDIKITIDQHGKATAQIMAERPETLALLQKDGNYLEKALQQAGLNSSAQDLHYSLKEQAQQQGSGNGGRRRRALFDGDEDAKTVTVDTHLRDDGLQHRINYQA